MTFFITLLILSLLSILYTLAQRKFAALQAQIETHQTQLIKQEKYIDELKAKINICLKVDIDSAISTIESMEKELGDLQGYVDAIESKVELNSLSGELFDNPSFLSGFKYQVDKYTSHYMREDETQSLIDDAIRSCSVEVDSIELSLFQNR